MQYMQLSKRKGTTCSLYFSCFFFVFFFRFRETAMETFLSVPGIQNYMSRANCEYNPDINVTRPGVRRKAHI